MSGGLLGREVTDEVTAETEVEDAKALIDVDRR